MLKPPRFGLLIVAALLALATPVVETILAAGQEPSPQDSRIAAPHDLDHPFTFTPAFETRDAWLSRRAALRTQVLVAVGLWPMPARTPLAPVVHGRIDRDGYTIEKVFFASLPGHYVSGNLYRPVGNPSARGAALRRPAVLSPHGHWENGRLLERSGKDAQALVDKGAERTIEAARFPLQARLANLARLGFVVFQYDMVGYADSKPLVHREGFADAEALMRLQSNMGLQTWNSLRALDFVASLPDVDPSRMAMTGESGGGTQTLLLSAIDDRLAAAFPSVMVSGAMQGGCVCENAPLLRIGTNNIELAALFAPKPIGLSAANDWTRDLFSLGLPELKTIYRLFDAEDRVTARFMPFEHGDHLPSRELMYNLFSTHLHPDAAPAAPIVEPAFTPVPPADLSVFDATHPRPADVAGVAEVRRYLTRTSDEAMTALAREPARLREVVSSALKVMVQNPFASDLEVRTAEIATTPYGSVTSAQLTRRGSGEIVRATLLAPRTPNPGAIVIWAHPNGRASLFGADGATPVPAVQHLLEGGALVIAPDMFLPDVAPDDPQAAHRPHVKNEDTFPPFFYGYNRAVLAERVRDLLTVVNFATSRRLPAVHLLALGRAGVWGLLARALAGDAITRASLDLDAFDFTDVRDPFDPMMLPGALKYGGIAGMLALCTSGQTEVYRPPAAVGGSTLQPGQTVATSVPDADRMAQWLLWR
jgi:hypothetical protein